MKLKEGDYILHNNALIAKVLQVSKIDSQIKVLPLVVKPEYFRSSQIPHWRTLKNIIKYEPTIKELFDIKRTIDEDF